MYRSQICTSSALHTRWQLARNLAPNASRERKKGITSSAFSAFASRRGCICSRSHRLSACRQQRHTQQGRRRSPTGLLEIFPIPTAFSNARSKSKQVFVTLK
jgi:hypothetical protein